MAGTTITDSTNITLLQSRIFVNVCSGQFIVDTSPSIFLGSGAGNVLGVKVQITNPYGVIIKPFGVSYDIAPPLTGTYEFDMPTQAGKIQYGIYKIEVQLTDADSTTYLLAKNVNVCTYTSDSHPCDERVRLIADCKNGTVTFQLAEPPTFKGKFAESKAQSVRIDYPTASGLPFLSTTVPNFSMALFQGVYKATVTVCANYDMGDNVWLQLPYNVTVEKNVKCLLDYACISAAVDNLNAKIEECNSQKDKEYYASVSLQALVYMKSAELANDAGRDSSDYIDKLEKLLGCTCTCDCSGSPIVNNTPSTNIAIEGCLFTKTTVGITDVYNFDGKHYFLTTDGNGILGISDAVEYGCTRYQQLSFSVEAAYNAIKGEVTNINEYNFWAGVIRSALAALDTSCLTGATGTLLQLMQAIVNKACVGGSCSSTISGVATVQSGGDVIISFTQTGGFSSDIYVDGILKGNVLSGVGTFTLENFADGATHSYAIIPKCSNGSNGTAGAGTFEYLACPFISPPSISDTLINNADCPYDLTTLVYPTPPLGIEVEWHTQNNTLSTSLVADPENVSSGVFYAFAKDADGCYSTATQVTLVCDGGTSCTAPQTLLVVNAVGGFKVSFQSANFPPPSNSYSVKRKAAADPDVDGSYTTIGTPVWNSSSNRWEITDTTGSNNTLYTYKAISNCASTTPSVLYNFANLTCPTVTLTPADTEMDYSFTGVGGEVDKYEVSIYDSTGAVLISTQTIVPAFSTPITGTFIYLTTGTTYRVRVKVFIGTFSATCDFQITQTSGSTSGLISNSSSANITIVEFDGVPVDYVSGDNLPIGPLEFGNFSTTELGATIDVTITIASAFATGNVRFIDTDGIPHDLPAVGPAVYTFNNVPVNASGGWNIQVNN